MEALVSMPTLIAGVALPVLAAAARDGRARLRYAIEGLSEGAVIAGMLVVLVTVRAAEPVMVIIGGPAFRHSGAVLRIQVGALLFGALAQIWAASLMALGRQRELILTNALGLLGLAIVAPAPVRPSAQRADPSLACSVTPCWRRSSFGGSGPRPAGSCCASDSCVGSRSRRPPRSLRWCCRYRTSSPPRWLGCCSSVSVS
jgi:hypothetical protein